MKFTLENLKEKDRKSLYISKQTNIRKSLKKNIYLSYLHSKNSKHDEEYSSYQDGVSDRLQRVQESLNH